MTPSRRRPGVHPGRRLAVGLACLVAALVVPATTVADPGATIATITVHRADGTTQTASVSHAQLTAKPCPSYGRPSMQERHTDGSVKSTGLVARDDGVRGTWTVASILDCRLRIPYAEVTRIIVSGDTGPELGSGSILTMADLRPGSDFEDPQDAPVISDFGSSLEYDRPWRGGSDADFSDTIPQNDPIGLDVFEGDPLNVTIAPPATVAAGAPVTLTATASGGQGAVSYAWSFPNSGVANSAAASPTVTFPAAGTYTIDLVATDDHGGGGGATTSITVTGAQAPPTPTTASTSTPSPGTSTQPTAPTRGPRRGRHGRPGGGSGVPTVPIGGATPPSFPRASGRGPTTQTQTQTQTTRTSTSTTGTHSTPTPTTTHSPPAPTPTPAPTPASPAPPTTTPSPTPTTPATATTPGRPRRSSPGARHSHRRRVAAGDETGSVVRGRLISALTTVPAGASPLTAPAPRGGDAGPVATRRGSVASPWAAIGGGILAAALLVAGAVRELGPERLARALRLRS